jgi:CMP/dCMP kinase
MNINNIPVIAIDGPSASGKGTVAQLVSESLGFHYLDSGSLYRLVALKAIRIRADLNNEEVLEDIAQNLDVTFTGRKIQLGIEEVADLIRQEIYGNGASKVAAHPKLREALLDRQRAFRKDPGLVTDGRDMCSVVFPDATLKIFLTAAPEIRAKRRYEQLMEKGEGVNLAKILEDIEARDKRDSIRSASPLNQNKDSSFIDTTLLNVTEVVNKILKQYSEINIKSI